MWSIKDKQTGDILKSGRNSDTKEEALEAAWDFWYNVDGIVFPREEIEELYEDKEGWLKNIGLTPFEHDEEIER